MRMVSSCQLQKLYMLMVHGERAIRYSIMYHQIIAVFLSMLFANSHSKSLITDRQAGTGVPYSRYAVFTTDETLLVRAEAKAMLSRYEEALADLNLELRACSLRLKFSLHLSKSKISIRALTTIL